MSGQALSEPYSLVEIALGPAGYATLNTVIFGEIILWPRGR